MLSTSAFKYMLLFVVLIGWFYFRLRRSMKRRGKLHGPHLWRETLRQRRREHLQGAETWEERHRRKENIDPERRIAHRFLGDKAGRAESQEDGQ